MSSWNSGIFFPSGGINIDLQIVIVIVIVIVITMRFAVLLSLGVMFVGLRVLGSDEVVGYNTESGKIGAEIEARYISETSHSLAQPTNADAEIEDTVLSSSSLLLTATATMRAATPASGSDGAMSTGNDFEYVFSPSFISFGPLKNFVFFLSFFLFDKSTSDFAKSSYIPTQTRPCRAAASTLPSRRNGYQPSYRTALRPISKLSSLRRLRARRIRCLVLARDGSGWMMSLAGSFARSRP